MKWLSFAAAGHECFGFVVGDANVVDYRDAVQAANGETFAAFAFPKELPARPLSSKLKRVEPR